MQDVRFCRICTLIVQNVIIVLCTCMEPSFLLATCCYVICAFRSVELSFVLSASDHFTMLFSGVQLVACQQVMGPVRPEN